MIKNLLFIATVLLTSSLVWGQSFIKKYTFESSLESTPGNILELDNGELVFTISDSTNELFSLIHTNATGDTLSTLLLDGYAYTSEASYLKNIKLMPNGNYLLYGDQILGNSIYTPLVEIDVETGETVRTATVFFAVEQIYFNDQNELVLFGNGYDLFSGGSTLYELTHPLIAVLPDDFSGINYHRYYGGHWEGNTYRQSPQGNINDLDYNDQGDVVYAAYDNSYGGSAYQRIGKVSSTGKTFAWSVRSSSRVEEVVDQVLLAPEGSVYAFLENKVRKYDEDGNLIWVKTLTQTETIAAIDVHYDATSNQVLILSDSSLSILDSAFTSGTQIHFSNELLFNDLEALTSGVLLFGSVNNQATIYRLDASYDVDNSVTSTETIVTADYEEMYLFSSSRLSNADENRTYEGSKTTNAILIADHIVVDDVFESLLPIIAGDVNGNGTIDEGEIAGDVDGNGVIDEGEIAGDVNGNGVIDEDEIEGDNNGNGVIDGDEVVTGINDASESLDNIYPNPTSGQLTLPVASDYIIYNSQGMRLKEGNGKTLDLADFPEGNYFIKTAYKLYPVLKQ